MLSQPRVVVDPNVWVSALISPSGSPAGVLRAVLVEEVVAVASPHLLDELRAVLSREKFRRWVSLADAHAYVDGLAEKVDLQAAPGKPSQPTRDPADDYLVALAEGTNAILVTGDNDLLSAEMKSPAISPRELLDRLG